MSIPIRGSSGSPYTAATTSTNSASTTGGTDPTQQQYQQLIDMIKKGAFMTTVQCLDQMFQKQKQFAQEENPPDF